MKSDRHTLYCYPFRTLKKLLLICFMPDKVLTVSIKIEYIVKTHQFVSSPVNVL